MPDTLYVGTGGGWSPATDTPLRRIAMGNVRLVAVTDNNRQGEVNAERVRAIADEAGIASIRLRPRGDDCYDDLRMLLARSSSFALVAAG